MIDAWIVGLLVLLAFIAGMAFSRWIQDTAREALKDD